VIVIYMAEEREESSHMIGGRGIREYSDKAEDLAVIDIYMAEESAAMDIYMAEEGAGIVINMVEERAGPYIYGGREGNVSLRVE
jgi:hypothetical protein